jgi:hypothetical protein
MVGLTGVISMKRKEGGGIVDPTLPLQLKTVKKSSTINSQVAFHCLAVLSKNIHKTRPLMADKTANPIQTDRRNAI